jgi:hypothetical protein
MTKVNNISDTYLGNFLSERQFLICTKRDGDNYHDKVLVPFAKYIMESQDTSDYKKLNSKLTTYIHDKFQSGGTKEWAHEMFWKNASSIPRILPIIYFQDTPSGMAIRLTELAKQHYDGKFSSKEFLLLWALRFQGSEFSNPKVLTMSDISLVRACNNAKYRTLIEKRKVKPAILALQVMKKIKDRGVDSITDKQFRNARRLANQEDKDAIDQIVDLILAGDADDGSQEEQIFKILHYLDLCETSAYQQNNSRYRITGLGVEIAKLIEKDPFTYYRNSGSTKGYIDYIGSLPNDFEKRIIDIFKHYGGSTR